MKNVIVLCSLVVCVFTLNSCDLFKSSDPVVDPGKDPVVEPVVSSDSLEVQTEEIDVVEIDSTKEESVD